MDLRESELDHQLTAISTALASEEVNARLLKMSKRGKLAGYDAQCPDGLASVAAHGTPFDSKLVITHQGEELGFELKLIPLMPNLFIVLLVVSIWPGLPLTDVFLSSFQWYERFVANTGVKTWYWYLPMTVLPAPFMWKSAIAKSKTSSHQSAVETIEKISKVLSKDGKACSND